MDDGTTGYGSVPYTFQMGKYDVTTGQYTAFLNAVAKTDPYGLYNTQHGHGLLHPRHQPERQPRQLQLLGHGLGPGATTARCSMSPGAMRPGSATGCKTASRPAAPRAPARRRPGPIRSTATTTSA